jgi:hypothetical protein
MSEQQYHGEKYEKDEEKGEKEHEKEDVSWEEKWHRDPLASARWAGILIWAGLALLAENLGVLARFETLEAWDLIFAGAGLIVLLEVAVRLAVPSYRRPVTGNVIAGVFLLAVGFGNALGVSIVWPLVLIAFGVVVLLRGLFRGR